MLRSLLLVIACSPVVLVATPARAVPSVEGQWTGVTPWPEKAIHSILLHTGKVLWYRGQGSNAQSYEWDPVTNTMTSQPFDPDAFCSGLTTLSDGRVLVTGGNNELIGSQGAKLSYLYDPVTSTWTRGPDFRQGRYYPTNVLLGNGTTLTFSGYDVNEIVNEEVESFLSTQEGGTGQWQVLPGANRFMGYYPRMHLLPSGLVFRAGKEMRSEFFNPATRTWTPGPTSLFGNRSHGTSVMLPPGFNKIMILGDDGETNTTEIIDLGSPTPRWTYAPPMQYPRGDLNAVILPDGKVLIAGGVTAGPEYPVEMYDPVANTWSLMAPNRSERKYHSSALLLPDGRVLLAGADNNHTAEIYSPPYLFQGARPVIGSVPGSVAYGATFNLPTANAANITTVLFMRPGAATHAQDMQQKYIPLSFRVAASGVLEVTAPNQQNIAPPGYYMVFILGADKVPSVAKFIRLGGTAGPAVNQAPLVDAGAAQSITLPTVANLSGTASDDGLPAPPTLTTTWRKISGPGSVTFGDSLSRTTTATFTLAGTYELRLTASDGALSASDLVTITVLPSCGTTYAVDTQVMAGSDDAEERPTGAVAVTSSDLELTFDGVLQTVGLRFTNFTIPQGSTITSAYLQFRADEAHTEATHLTIRGQDADLAAAFTTATRNISSRPTTDAFVNWQPAAWVAGVTGPAQRTPDLSAVFQEIVDRPGWQGNSLAILITGTGHRTASAFEGNLLGAPHLVIEIGGCSGPVNRAPLVDAGPTQTVTHPAAASLGGTVSDDGLPAPPASVRTVWSKSGGPGAVTFADSLSRNTTATFTVPGTYELRLSASDGALTASDLVTVVVQSTCGGAQIIESRLAAGSDDGEERPTGGVALTSTDLELVFDGVLQTVGLRFTGLDIPAGSTISNAWIQFRADEVHSEATSLTIRGHDADGTTTFTTAAFNISSRPRTDASVTWQPAAWTIGATGPDQRTPDLSAVIQEIVARPGWQGGSLSFIFTGTGRRAAAAFEDGAPRAPLLHIEMSCGAPGNRAPVVEAGPNQALAAPGQATLAGRGTDDGLPIAPGELRYSWVMVNGPGAVTFVDHEVAQTNAFFPATGTYLLRLTAFDGERYASDSVTIAVQTPTATLSLDRRVSAGPDDAEESSLGAVVVSSSDLELVDDLGLQTVGLRFAQINLPQGAAIQKAHVQFAADEAQTEATSLTLHGQAADNAAVFTTLRLGISTRPRTTASALWSPAPWTTGAAGDAQKTTDLAAVIQEIVGRPGWVSGNALAIIITGTGHRTAEGFEGGAALAPLLHIEYAGSEVTHLHGRNPGTTPAPAPVTTRLAPLVPNPGPGSRTVRFELARESHVDLEIYDLRGALVRRIANEWRGPGSHSATWDGRDRSGRKVAKGVYLVRFAAADHRESRKLVILE